VIDNRSRLKRINDKKLEINRNKTIEMTTEDLERVYTLTLISVTTSQQKCPHHRVLDCILLYQTLLP
jgi:hypothetical protein